MTQRKDHYSEVEKNVTKVLVLFECTVIRQYYVPKMKLPFSVFHVSHFKLWACYIKVFRFAEMKA